ncbi:S66 peptidase family protein [Candidatus Arthromitus sp. SFB-rat-Yit]|uniref:S66 peptidase family protein n=1 Tax=Candidatus Arthromitus sp. SFB-rat-Yit TaxID=1041504 RepID=UPI000227A08C|nr:LD-carboxypeptidase [Candidatus Arthromitus sp. SFB-rat-Yit]BAK81817.1 peptidase U61 LD-carboxypeptidase A [Candidatus Arthromitus sp. SFB-rat-Yit]
MAIACKKLIFGDKISIISPSSPSSKETIENALNSLKSLNFCYKTYNHLYDDTGYLAGLDIHRAEDFNNALKDKESKAIMCLRGGYGSLRIMDIIKWSLFKKNPKIFMGFSDITPILNYIFKKFNIITFHSPMLTSDLTNEYSRDSLINSISIPRSNYFIKNPENIPLKSFSSLKNITVGNIVGGNLSLICSTISTKYEIPFKNNILFLEEVNESPYKVDRMLHHLYLTGKIQKCSGIILGQFTECKDDNNVNIEEVLLDKLRLFNKPCIYNLCAGHGSPRLTIPIGARARINTNNSTIEILQSIVV